LIDFSGLGIYIFHLLFSAQVAKNAVENANESAQIADDADTDTAQIVDDTVVNDLQ
jgi:hypothetical protein